MLSFTRSSTMSDTHYIAATLRWVDEIVIHHNFCPFAQYARYPGGIYCHVSHGDTGDILAELFDECQRLDNNPSIATTLMILASPDTESFDSYLDVLAIGEKMLSDWGYTGTYQLASFHPDYQFEGEEKGSVANYTNRSPFPLLHLIRESDIAKYMKNEDDAEKIYRHNIEQATELGCPYFAAKLQALKTP